MTETERLLERIARAWADQEPVDWNAAERSPQLTAAQLEQLRALDEVTHALRRVQRDADIGASRAPPLFRWGGLEVQAELSAGAQGTIYRTYDPVLAQTVALKLSRTNVDNAASLTQQLQEVRGLAKVRHRNVLSIYGAAEHDGRFGIWSELIEGSTLEQLLADQGPFAIDDALAIGRDLGAALVAVHARGLIHGDIKTANVLRERGGRIVLADFGASRAQGVLTQSTISGTRHYLPPEALLGADTGKAADVYALAVLLYRVLSAHYPYAADTPDELMQAQRSAPPEPLLRWRPDAPEELSRLLAHALTSDPAQRLSQADAFLDALSTIARARHPLTAPQRKLAHYLLAAALLAAAVAGGVWWSRPQPASVDIAPAFVRENGDQLDTLRPGSIVHTGDLLALTLTLPHSSFVYIFNEDSGGQLSALFPLSDLDRRNPLPAATLELPGNLRGQPFRWRISSTATGEEFLVVIAPSPVAQLDAALNRAVQPTISSGDAVRGVAGLQARERELPHFTGAGLSALATQLAARPDVSQLRISRFQYAQRD